MHFVSIYAVIQAPMATERYETKYQFTKKATDEFLKKVHGWNTHELSFRMVYIMSFEASETFQRTVSSDNF